ncbi:non-hydrolyzing UDP-N-acetylglucosamine 2-epimerase [Spirilliplanes yamanashiensis]|uniref:UDP-N-acetylglucosamine 2-epimerase (non-hydrolyzing) n=1 Tax=Spirilliplanes yamanashiensis TaxID=42233 RepID=A0A8J4DI30_9ACTN|nr:UDP-N-acetylglucosamine 2-epimerase (non-hydrolyzing) [Spirilliplanes yamanashiensis]MDP9814714.1 UDP-N-acetylglucosamine 2-epimerase (non-hydrolyzing) [Spirilliplanes yamanashiensis]GIJ02366.1 UDP-N-acetyl glucosamine 2-epimerase [Spirilliplanes yamanashiensis]
MTHSEVHLVGGTRLEAVKLAPVAVAMRAAGLVAPVLVAGGRHPARLRQALAAFDLEPDVTLDVEPGGDSRAELLTELVRGLDALWSARPPAAVVVQGDSTTSLAGALAAYALRIPVVHLEAGVRSGDLESPFPEEANRRLVAQIARLHLAPTPPAAMNLVDEGVGADGVLITGNTVVDATLAVAARKLPYEDADVAAARAASHGRRLILVTAHRRESWGAPLDRILEAVRALVRRYSDVEVVLPSHPDPAVRAQVDAALGGMERVTVTGPLPYPDLARLLSEAYLVLTDSGGLQEEAPSFGVPALVLRDVTERVESLNAGCARLVGSDTDLIVKEAAVLLDDRRRRDAMTASGNPYGDGLAAARAAQATAALLGLAEPPEAMPAVVPAAASTGVPA